MIVFIRRYRYQDENNKNVNGFCNDSFRVIFCEYEFKRVWVSYRARDRANI